MGAWEKMQVKFLNVIKISGILIFLPMDLYLTNDTSLSLILHVIEGLTEDLTCSPLPREVVHYANNGLRFDPHFNGV